MADLSFLEEAPPAVGQDKPNVFAVLGQEEIDEAREARDLGVKMLGGYFEARRSDLDNWKILSIEQNLIVPVLTPKGKVSTAWAEAVVMDLVVEDVRDGRILVVDHKGYGRSGWGATSKILMFAKQTTSYWRALRAVIGREPDGHVTNVLFKDAPKEPKINLSGAPSCAKDQGTTAELYEAALANVDLAKVKPAEIEKCKAFLAWLKAQPPREYFTRVTVARTQAQLAKFDEDDRVLMREMKSSTPIRAESWSSCPSCDFFGLCTMGDTPEARMNFEKRDLSNDTRETEFKLIGLKRLGKRQVISHSRRDSYLRCRQQHAYRYREGLRPTQRAAFFDFGTFLHEALAVWYGGPHNLATYDLTQTYKGNDKVAIDVFLAQWREGFAKRYGKSFEEATAAPPAGF